MGDVNAAATTTFETKLIARCNESNDLCFIVSNYEDLINFRNNLHTFSDAHSTTSLWVYFICSYDLHVNIFNMQISDTSPSSDHLSACDVYIDDYNSITHIILKTINILADVFFCKDVDCKFVASYDYNIMFII